MDLSLSNQNLFNGSSNTLNMLLGGQGMIDFLLDVIFTPSKAWIGIIIGILVSACIYFLFPESGLRNTFAMVAVVAGFLIGFILLSDMDKK